MKVAGFLMEDERGQEFVVVCDQPEGQPGPAFALRDWQRRHLVPLPCTGPELRHLTGHVRTTLTDLVHHLPTGSEDG